MIEIPEARTLAKQLNNAVAGQSIARIHPPTKPHKFFFTSHDIGEMNAALSGAQLKAARGFGMFCEIELDNSKRVTFNDGVNLRYVDKAAAPKDYQMLVELSDGALALTIAMYGGVNMRDGAPGDSYYDKALSDPAFDSPGFEANFHEIFSKSKPGLSAKAFMATEQRFPGIGNGVLQDILFNANINPRRKLMTLDNSERAKLLAATQSTLRAMTDSGGRDTERDLFGAPGGYKTLLSKKTLASGCPVCGGEIIKEAYLGGSVYYCPRCQPR